MGRWRWVTGVGVVAVLAGAAIFLSLQDDEESTVTTTSVILTTTSQVEITTTTEASTTSTTTAEQRQAEVEQLLKDLWFGWFDAIYRKDPDALWQVVATTQFYEDGVAAMDTMEFTAEPTAGAVVVTAIEVLLDRPDCLVVHNAVDMTAFRGTSGEPIVSVLWPDQRYGFRFATDWQFVNDIWINDCDNLERGETP